MLLQHMMCPTLIICNLNSHMILLLHRYSTLYTNAFSHPFWTFICWFVMLISAWHNRQMIFWHLSTCDFINGAEYWSLPFSFCQGWTNQQSFRNGDIFKDRQVDNRHQPISLPPPPLLPVWSGYIPDIITNTDSKLTTAVHSCHPSLQTCLSSHLTAKSLQYVSDCSSGSWGAANGRGAWWIATKEEASSWRPAPCNGRHVGLCVGAGCCGRLVLLLGVSP